MKFLSTFFSLAFALLFLGMTTAHAATPSANTPVTHAELDELIHQYLLDHPEAILESVSALQEREEAKAKVKASAAVKANQSAIYEGKDTPSAGDTKTPEITIVEFFDYNCGVCKSMFSSIDKIAKSPDSHVRLLFKEFPIFGPTSEQLSKIALAINRLDPEKYYQFHSALMTLPGKADGEMLQNLVRQVGLDPGKVMGIALNPEITHALDENHKIGKELGIKGTPTLIIGDEVIPHALGYDELLAKIAQQKQKAAKGK